MDLLQHKKENKVHIITKPKELSEINFKKSAEHLKISGKEWTNREGHSSIFI